MSMRRIACLLRLSGNAVGTADWSPATAIVEAAEESREPTLVLVGNRDLEQLVRIRLGSVSSDVLRAADGPVLIHKRPAG